jgi:type IV secretion system protein VirD4
LCDVPDGLRDLGAQILPEPAQKDGENTYWREGLRRTIANAASLGAMIEEYDATLSSVALLIEGRDALGGRNQARRQSPPRSIDHSGGPRG